MRRWPSALRAAVAATLAVSTLVGCARFYWVKPGSTPEQFTRDSAECEKEATVSPAAARSVEQSTYRSCLASKGYTREELYMPGADAYRGLERQP
jgi:hypothetical protein